MQRKKENLLLTFNGYKIYVRNEGPEEYLSHLFLNTCDLEYWSFESLLKFYYGSIELIVEYCCLRREVAVGCKKAMYTRFINTGTNKLLKRKFSDRYSILYHIYNSILKSEGMGFLRGFGIKSSCGDLVKGNPEYSSMFKNRIYSGKESMFKSKLHNNYKKGKELKMSIIKFGELKKGIQALNATGFLENKIKFVGVRKDVLVGDFLDAVDGCSEENKGNLPEEVVAMYNTLVDASSKDSPTGEEGKSQPETEEKDECPDFGKKYEKGREECEKCKKEFSEDYKKCKDVVTSKSKPSDPSEEEQQEEDTGSEKTKESEKCPEFGTGYVKNSEKCNACLDDFPDDYAKCKKMVTADKKPVRKTKSKTTKPKTTESKVKKPKAKKEKKERYGRLQAFCDAAKKGGTKQEIIEREDHLYVSKNGGESNLKAIEYHVPNFLGILVLMGTMTVEGKGKDKTYKFIK